MADRKISDLTALTTPASGDFLPIVDISEAAAASKNKRITIEELMRGMPDGTAAAPGIAFETDPNTGIFSPGADQVAISTNGTQRINIEADGDINIDGGGVFYDATNNRLAIGTTSPGSALEINAAAATSPFIAKINTAEVARIDSSGTLLVGTSTARAYSRIQLGSESSASPTLQIESNSVLAGIGITTNRNDETGTLISLSKTRSTSAGGTNAVQNNDILGQITFAGADGTDIRNIGARIACEVDGTPGNNDMPGRLVFSTTADGGSSPTERMRIKANGAICIGTTTENTMSGDTVVAIGTNIGIISKTASGIATSSTVDININTGGGGYQGFLIVSNTNAAAAGSRTHTTFSVFGRGTDSSIQQIATDNGTTSGLSFTVTTPTNGVIRVTNTSVATTTVHIQFFGGTSF